MNVTLHFHNKTTHTLELKDAQAALTNIQGLLEARGTSLRTITSTRFFILPVYGGYILSVKGRRDLEYPKLRMALQAAIESERGDTPTAAQLAKRTS